MKSARRLSSFMLHQNACLRKSIRLEFTKLSGGAKYSAAMAEYRETLLSAVDSNDAVLREVFGTPETGLWNDFLLTWQSGDVYDGLGSLWRHCAKDWTREGAEAQGGLRARIVQLVRDECRRLRSSTSSALPSEEPVRILVPGCGQGRLAYEIASALPSEAAVLGVEISDAQLAFASHFLNGGANRLDFHPWLDAFANNLDVESRAGRLSAPDILTTSRSSSNLSLRQGDFVKEPSSAQKHQIVVTSFLLDCVDDLVGGMRAVRQSLAPNGLWVYAGPLHYHQGGQYTPRAAPTLTQLVSLASDHGLELEAQPELLPAPYVRRPGAFLAEADWSVPVFGARLLTS